MADTKSKRELFGSLVASLKKSETKVSLLRPPYFSDESLFLSECSKCEGKCATACEEKIINIYSDHTPYIDFSLSGCTYCDKCALTCEYGVLKLEDKKQLSAKITIDTKECLSWGHTMCFSCKDPCLENAIDFKALFMPSINSKCTSCGFCINRCPSDAIKIEVL